VAGQSLGSKAKSSRLITKKTTRFISKRYPPLRYRVQNFINRISRLFHHALHGVGLDSAQDTYQFRLLRAQYGGGFAKAYLQHRN